MLVLIYAVAALHFLVDVHFIVFKVLDVSCCASGSGRVCICVLKVYVKLVPIFSGKQITKESHYIVCILCHAQVWKTFGEGGTLEKERRKEETH